MLVCVIVDNEDRRKKITIAIKPVGQNRNDSTDNITHIRNVVQGLRLSPTLQVSALIMCGSSLLIILSLFITFLFYTGSVITTFHMSSHFLLVLF